tara:strand:+ start:3076 stop:3249 length:174 start_codon:yes stop_codon:yes gene_type:complete
MKKSIKYNHGGKNGSKSKKGAVSGAIVGIAGSYLSKKSKSKIGRIIGAVAGKRHQHN